MTFAVRSEQGLSILLYSLRVDSMVELTKLMREACGSKLIAVTCGEDSSILATENQASLSGITSSYPHWGPFNHLGAVTFSRCDKLGVGETFV